MSKFNTDNTAIAAAYGGRTVSIPLRGSTARPPSGKRGVHAVGDKVFASISIC